MTFRVGGFALALMGSVWAMPLQAQDASTVVATVNGTEITLGHLSALRNQLPAQYLALPDDALFKGILEQVIQQTALSQAAEGLVTKADEISMENDRRAYMAGLVLQDAAKNAVTDEAIQKAYDARYKDAAPATEYNAAHILVATEEEAKKIKTDLAEGKDFAELAKQLSTDTGSGQAGGSLGWFGLGAMVKPFEDAVVALKAGEISEPVQSQFGWHIVKLVETRPLDVPTLDAVKAELAEQIETEAIDLRIKAATEGAKVERSDEGIDPAILKSETLFGK